MGSELLSSRGWEEAGGSSVTEASRHGNRGWLHRSGEGKERTGQDTEPQYSTVVKRWKNKYINNCFIPTSSVPDPQVFGPPGSGSMVICTDPDPFNKPKTKKYLDFCGLLAYNDLLSLKPDVNVPTKSNKQKYLKKI
jgi:hypothetical protein